MPHWSDSVKQLHAKIKSLAMMIDWQRTLLQEVLTCFDHLESVMQAASRSAGDSGARPGKPAKRRRRDSR